MEPINYFESVAYLEPTCPNCNTKLQFGINTAYKDDVQAHVCLNCGEVVEEANQEIAVDSNDPDKGFRPASFRVG
jgi:transcription initiation factor TFIIIB Brf1 subunit/transcription initiation factor TFIIB